MLPSCIVLEPAKTPYNREGLSFVSPRTTRSDLIAMYGQPDSTSYQQGKEVDLFESESDGPKPGEKAGFVAAALVFDVLTMGVAEGSPRQGNYARH
jgi:hypothetical protein